MKMCDVKMCYMKICDVYMCEMNMYDVRTTQLPCVGVCCVLLYVSNSSPVDVNCKHRNTNQPCQIRGHIRPFHQIELFNVSFGCILTCLKNVQICHFWCQFGSSLTSLKIKPGVSVNSLYTHTTMSSLQQGGQSCHPNLDQISPKWDKSGTF